MRLHSISLSGFKSFADHTPVSFPSQIAGVVGPNGSGKSNIVDAIRWVLGERSARELRSGQISDVIFNGSSTRNAASKAKIELRFENVHGKLKGDFARFDEISVSREVDNEGTSTYFINNVRARRRDVVDCFLGTGLGPRSYAIIQQGTVSRLVEAKPDELRQHLEEVAGISLYRERRHETELRLKNTRENLSRLLDTIEELDKQLRQLKRQAENAGKYRSLKTERDALHNQLVVARWRQLQKRISKLDDGVIRNRNKSESLTAGLRKEEAELAQITTGSDELQRRIDQQQQQNYALKQEIALLEQQIGTLELRQKDVAGEIQQASEERMRLQAQITTDRAEHSDLESEITKLSTDDAKQQQVLAEQGQELHQVEKEFTGLQSEFQQSQHANFEVQKKLELLRYQINNNEQQMQESQSKADKLAQPDSEFDTTCKQLVDAGKREQHSIDTLRQSLDELEKAIAVKREVCDTLHAEYKQIQVEATQVEREINQGEGRIASLQTLIENKTSQPGVKVTREQIKQYKLEPMLAQLQVAEGWEGALEHAFGDLLRGYLAESSNDLAGAAKALAQSGISIGRARDVSGDSPPKNLFAFADIIKGPVPGWFCRVWFAENLDAALVHWGKLTDQRIVCKDGSIVAQDWVTLGHTPQGETLVSLQQRLNHNTASVKELQQRHELLNTQFVDSDARLAELRKELDSEQEQLRSKQQDMHSAQSRLEKINFQQSAAQQAELQRNEAHTELIEQGAALRETFATLQQQLTDTLEHQEMLQQQHGAIKDRHGFTEERVKSMRAKVNEHNEAGQVLRLQLSNAQTRRDAIVRNTQLVESSLNQLTNRMEKNTRQAEDLARQPSVLRSQLEGGVAQLQGFEKELASLRQQLDDSKHQAGEVEKKIRDFREQLAEKNQATQQLQLEITEARTKQQAFVEQLFESDFDTAAATTPEDLPISESQSTLDGLERSIRSLGEVNHAAIKDYEIANERRESLSAQHAEIQQAIATLESAIAKIDRETRSLFQDTFNRLNVQFKRIFAEMLGGGDAWLELTSNDMLNSGVQIIARPPGKKNTTIAMLSGGEKAMTAISLVLALFSLNPAPFCVLDEVDAPLDDHNVVRFASTIQKIAAQVQFVVVTHSKITMEYMDTLFGVTMSEPGVSRIVSVDIDSAMKMVV